MKCNPLLGAAACGFVSLASATAFAQTSPTAPSATSTEPSVPAPRDSDASHRDGGVHVGLLGGVGFPRPLAIEGLLEFDRLVVLGAEYSALPTTTFSGVQTSLWALAADGRVFPFRNGFFIGLRAGKQHLSETASVTVGSAGSVSGSNTADTTFLRIGVDAGVQIPILSTSSSSLPAGVSPPSGAAALSRTLGQEAIPTIDLLRFGVVM
jgi:hypothetical protein